MKSKKSSFISLYNLSQIKLTKFRRYIENALIKRWIKHSISLANALILFVLKRNKDLRLCVNYKKLNAMTIKNRHSLSSIIEILNRLCETRRFIKLNLKNVYHCIRIKQNDEWKTTFRTRYDHFEYQVISFELINASIIFQVYINKTLRELVDVICVIYLNNILIFNEDSTQHWDHVRAMLKRLRDYNLYVNLKKCEFNIIWIEFLNFIVFTKRVRMNEERIRIIKKWSSLKHIESYKCFWILSISLNVLFFNISKLLHL